MFIEKGDIVNKTAMLERENIMMSQKRKGRQLKRDMRIKENLLNSVKKNSMWKIEYQILHIRKLGIRKILRYSWYMKNVDTRKTQKVK